MSAPAPVVVLLSKLAPRGVEQLRLVARFRSHNSAWISSAAGSVLELLMIIPQLGLSTEVSSYTRPGRETAADSR